MAGIRKRWIWLMDLKGCEVSEDDNNNESIRSNSRGENLSNA